MLSGIIPSTSGITFTPEEQQSQPLHQQDRCQVLPQDHIRVHPDPRLSASPHISIPQSARIHDHGTRCPPQWPHDHRRNVNLEYSGRTVPRKHTPSTASPGSHGRHHSMPITSILASNNGKVVEEILPSSTVEVRIPSRATIRDGDKNYESTSPTHHFSSSEPLRSSRSYIISDLESADGQVIYERGYSGQTPRALIHLGLSAPFMSLVACLYTILVLIFILLTTPFHLCSSDPTKSASARTIYFLLPPLNAQRRCIFASAIPSSLSHSLHAKDRTEGSPSAPPTHDNFILPCKTTALISTHLLSPFISLPLTLGAWITAFAWLPSAMLSHERTAGVSDDERRMAERLVRVWVWWLDRSVVDTEQERRGRKKSRYGSGD